jgi:hypothetical protein
MRSSPPDTGRTIAAPTRTVTVVQPTVIVPPYQSQRPGATSTELPEAPEHDQKEKKSKD